MIAALEPLSTLFDERQFTLENLSLPGIFGEDNIAGGFDPAEFEKLAAQVHVIPDGGVIKLQTEYRFDEQPHDPKSIPEHYRFAPGGQDIFKHSSRGAYMYLQSAPNGMRAYMDGVGTASHFKYATAGDLKEMARDSTPIPQFKTSLDAVMPHILSNGLYAMHPASFGVVRGIGLELFKDKLVPHRNLPFPLPDIERSNGSSATTPNIIMDIIINGRFDLKQWWGLIAPGIGSEVAIGIIRLKS